MAPSYSKTILCLANSRKLAGRCVAGKEIVDGKVGEWIRPVSARPTGELSEANRHFEGGQEPKLLDVVRIPLSEPRPHGYQTENHVIDADSRWTKEGEATWEDLIAAIDQVPGPLWDNSARSSYNGLNDRVEEAVAAKLDSSLRLIEVTDLKIFVGREGKDNPQRKVRGHFKLKKQPYWLAVTDPVVESKYLAGGDGMFPIGNAVLCVSLGEPFGGYAYKLIAGVFVKPVGGTGQVVES